MSNIVNGNFPDHRGTPPTTIPTKSAFALWVDYWVERYGWVNCFLVIVCVVGGGLTMGIWGALIALGLEGIL